MRQGSARANRPGRMRRQQRQQGNPQGPLPSGPGSPSGLGPGGHSNKGPGALWVIIGVVVIAAGAIFWVISHRSSPSSNYANEPYAPQLSRNAEWSANPNAPLSDDAIDKIARNAAYEVIPKFANNFNIEAHFSDASRLVDAAKKYGNDLKVFDYYSASYWINANIQGWGKYAAGFQQSWLMHDASGHTIPYWGTGGASSNTASVAGYLLDLSNPDYRAWAVKTIVSWMKAAPYSGIAFDAATQMPGPGVSHYVSNGAQSYNQMLCGAAAARITGDCGRVQAWNAGLADLISSTANALHELGDEVLYNGIAPSVLRGATRNTGLLHYADAASNEGFCTSVSATNHDRNRFNSFIDDAAIVKQAAENKKKIFEITNTYGSSAKTTLADYCLAGFLIGWQPGTSYFIYHTGYKDLLTAAYPECPEQNLALGTPRADYKTDGDLITREFTNGFVAVNPTDSELRVTVPDPIVAFQNGKEAGRYAAGTTVTLPGRGALLGLNLPFVYGPTARAS